MCLLPVNVKVVRTVRQVCRGSWCVPMSGVLACVIGVEADETVV